MEMRFFRCETCGQIAAIVKKTSAPLICCGKPMTELVPGSIDASVEKHVPVFRFEGNRIIVTVGSTEHPMVEEHFIEWIALKSKAGNQRKSLSPGEKPEVCFTLCEGDEIEAVFAYCNLHGLWKA